MNESNINQRNQQRSPFQFFFPGMGPFRPGFPQGPGFPMQPGLPPPPPFEGPTRGDQPPSGSPPAFTPQRPRDLGQPGTFRVDPGAIRPCRNRFVYIWLNNRQQFWAWLTFVGRNSVAGWRWTGFRWVFFGTDIDNIDTFICY